MSEQSHTANIQGEPLEAEDLFLFAPTENGNVSAGMILSAIEWWEQNASPDWQDVLDKEPIADA